MRRAILLLWALAGSTARAQSAPPGWPYPLDRPAVVAARDMVATDAPLATHVGAEMLAAGGNAVDAAVASALALAVVYPMAGNLGGGGFAVVRTARGETAALDFRERAPAAATRDMYVGKGPGASLIGPRAAGVPGSVAGLYELHRRYGSKKWSDVVAPAVRLAEEGFKVPHNLTIDLCEQAGSLARFPASRALFFPDGRPLQIGAVWKNPDLAATLRRIAERGAADFYQGETARLIVAEMAHGGLITAEDLRAYRPLWRKPIETSYRGHRLLLMPLPSSGGFVLAMVLGILEGWDLAALGWHSPAHLHLVAEAERRAFAVRNTLLGDPDFVEIPGGMLSPAAIAKQRASISLERATPSSEVVPALPEGIHTTHLSVVDRDGAAVALTTTLNESFGSGATVTGAGFLLNDEMDDFTTEVGKENLFGLKQGERNAIAPGKRMLSSLAPTIVVAPNGQVELVLGAAGGGRIISSTLQVISNVVDFHMSLGPAVAAPRMHHQHLPDKITLERNGFGEAQTAGLRALGHVLATRAYIGDVVVVGRHAGGGWEGVADPRRAGAAEGN